MRNACEIWNRVKEVEKEKYSTVVAETAIKVCFVKVLIDSCLGVFRSTMNWLHAIIFLQTSTNTVKFLLKW